jgi:uncharacterized membrane protein
VTSPDTETESPILPAHIEETVQAIARLHAQHRQGATRVQRLVEGLTRGVGRPSAAGVLALAAAGWIGVNLALQLDGRPAPDPLPFGLLQTTVGVMALFVTLFILITQRREDQLSELREQLTLELAILGDQKSAKMIELLEELRRDLPQVRDREDAQAATMARPADPEAVLAALKISQESEPGGGVPTGSGTVSVEGALPAPEG